MASARAAHPARQRDLVAHPFEDGPHRSSYLDRGRSELADRGAFAGAQVAREPDSRIFFQRHEEYSKFIDLLQNPKLLKNYKAFVIDRPDFQSASCGISRVKVFHQLLKEHAKEFRGKATA